MFKYRAIRRNANPHGLSGFKCYLGLRDGFGTVDARIHARAGQLQRLLIGHDRLVIQILQLILSTQLEVESRKSGLFQKLFIFEVRSADLSSVLKFADGVADAAQQVRSPGHIDR